MSEDAEFVTGVNGGRLKPAWKPGQSGNPSGLTKDGRWTHAPKLEEHLHRALRRKGKLQKLVETWVDAAIDGSDAAREQILKRLYPVPESEPQGSGKVVFEGIRLEVRDGGKVHLSLHAPGDHAGDALTSEPESQRESSTMELPASPIESSSESPRTPEY